MKSAYLIGFTLLSSFLAGCSSTPLSLAPVGPNPTGAEGEATTGQLEVYSALQECHDGNEFDNNPLWYQHSDYVLCNLNGRPMKHVFNSVGHYAQRPRPIALAPGRYLVKAEAKDYMSVVVPVVIKAGRTTRVHLDDAWNPGAFTTKSELVSTPTGYPVGWRVTLTKTGR